MPNPMSFISPDLQVESWNSLEPLFNDLLIRKLDNTSSLEQWLKDKSALDAFLEENMAWRYIRMTIDTTNEEYSKAYSFFVSEIAPKISPLEDLLNKKLMTCLYTQELEEKDPAFHIYLRSVKTSIELFREENIPLQTEISEKSKEYGSISAAQSVKWKGESLTMQQASKLLKEQDVAIRQEIFEKITARRSEDIEALERLFDELIQLRHKIAVNAGFENFRDYKFVAMGRFDYSKEDCFAFHKAIEESIVPIARELQKEQCDKIQENPIKPWNMEVDPDGKGPLKPFTDGCELLAKSKTIFKSLNPFFFSVLDEMEKKSFLDLDSKKGKAPGGYNYPLYQSGYPFIFMNAAGSQRDVVTMVHEGGHAVHSVLSKDLELTAFKNLPSEVAELASMSMELLTMDAWSEFYSDKEEQRRAIHEHLVDIIKVLPWIATIDAFQHWIYENPTHTREERKLAWAELQTRFGNPFTDWTNYETAKEYSWHRQLHLFEVPFYYIEYGIAQLGALGVWMNSLKDKPKAISDYMEALKLGYTRSIPEIYETANVPFDFSKNRLEELAHFLKEELNKWK